MMTLERVAKIRRATCTPDKCSAQHHFDDPCAACPNGRWGVYSREQCGDVTFKPAEPTKLAKLRNLVKAVAAETKAIAQRKVPVTAEEHQRRLGICATCPEYIAEKDRCRKCGCNLSVKARWRSQSCPIGKW